MSSHNFENLDVWKRACRLSGLIQHLEPTNRP